MPNSYQYIPELNYWFNNYYSNNSDLPLDIYIPVPEIENSNDIVLLPSNSMLELLFNDLYTSDTTSYNYMFKTMSETYAKPSILRRLKYLPNTISCYVSDISGEYDIFNILDSTNNTNLLDSLLDFRLNGTTDISSYDIDALDTKLSKLIFIYLNLMINGIYTELNTSTPISDTTSLNSLLDNLFEFYVVNEAHQLISLWKTYTDSNLLELRPIRKIYTVTELISIFKTITILDPLPHDTDYVYVYVNGKYYDNTKYTFASDSTSITFILDSTGADGINLRQYDKVIIDYYKSVNPNDPS